MITIEEIMKLENLRDAKILAGHKGLNKNIKYVNVLEVPDIIDWIEPKELILTTAYPYQNDIDGLENLIKKLHKENVSALAIKPERYIDRVPNEVIVLGNKLDFPIIQLPANARFDILISVITREILNKDYSIIKESEDIHQGFTDLVLSGGNLKEIANVLADITGHFVCIKDSNGKEITKSKNFKNVDDSLALVEIRSIYIYERVKAYIELRSVEEEFTKKNIMALERAREAAAIVLLKKSAEEAIEKGYKSEFLTSFINGEFKSKEAIIARGRQYGLQIENSYLLFLINIDFFDGVFSESYEKIEIRIHNVVTDIYNIIFNSYISRFENLLLWSMNSEIYILYPLTEKSDGNVHKLSKKIVNQIKEKINTELPDLPISIGVGRFYEDIMDINKSYREALEALRIGKIICGNHQIYHFDDIEIYTMLLKSFTKQELEAYVEQKIGKLIAQDNSKNTNLVETLDMLINHNGILKNVAEEMFVHPKTVAYRKQRIEEILEISLKRMDIIFELYLAIKMIKLL